MKEHEQGKDAESLHAVCFTFNLYQAQKKCLSPNFFPRGLNQHSWSEKFCFKKFVPGRHAGGGGPPPGALRTIGRGAAVTSGVRQVCRRIRTPCAEFRACAPHSLGAVRPGASSARRLRARRSRRARRSPGRRQWGLLTTVSVAAWMHRRQTSGRRRPEVF